MYAQTNWNEIGFSSVAILLVSASLWLAVSTGLWFAKSKKYPTTWLIHSLVGMAIGSGAISRVKVHIKRLKREGREAAAKKYTGLLSSMENWESIADRDRRWCNAIWWISRVQETVNKSFGRKDFDQGFPNAHKRHRADYQMLIIELLLQNYWEDHGHYPETLKQVVSIQLARLFVDPFAQNNASFQYIQENNGYLLYSVGENGIDDGGHIQPDQAMQYFAKDHSLERHLLPTSAEALWSEAEQSTLSGNPIN